MLRFRSAVAVLIFAASALASSPLARPALSQPVNDSLHDAADHTAAEPNIRALDSGSQRLPVESIGHYGFRLREPSLTGGTKASESAPNAFCESKEGRGADRQGLRILYCAETPVITRPLDLAHRSSYPVFYTAVPVAWLGAAARGMDDVSDAYRLTLTQGATYLTIVSLKRLFKRPRPFMRVPGVTSRSGKYGRATPDGQFASLPSGHAGLSVALATSWSLSHPYWYVIAPSAIWSGAVSLSRLHLGVHYPSDILLGAVLGAGIATGIHVLRDALTPSAFEPEREAAAKATDPAAVLATGPMVVLFRATF